MLAQRLEVEVALHRPLQARRERVFELALDGDGPADGGVLAAEAGWVTELPGVRLAHRGVETSEFSVADGTDPARILDAALSRGARVTHFEIADPSLEEVFIEHVGRRAVDEEERHLAETAAGNR